MSNQPAPRLSLHPAFAITGLVLAAAAGFGLRQAAEPGPPGAIHIHGTVRSWHLDEPVGGCPVDIVRDGVVEQTVNANEKTGAYTAEVNPGGVLTVQAHAACIDFAPVTVGADGLADIKGTEPTATLTRDGKRRIRPGPC